MKNDRVMPVNVQALAFLGLKLAILAIYLKYQLQIFFAPHLHND